MRRPRRRARALRTRLIVSPFCRQEFLLKIFCVFRNLMKLTIFPRDWSVMRLLTSQ